MNSLTLATFPPSNVLLLAVLVLPRCSDTHFAVAQSASEYAFAQHHKKAKRNNMLRRVSGGVLAHACSLAHRSCRIGKSSDDETLSSLLAELDQCELSATGAKGPLSGSDIPSRGAAKNTQAPPPRASRREKTELLRQQQLKKLIVEADQEIEFLEVEQRRSDTETSVGSLAPASTSDHFLSGSEQVLEKSPQHFVPSAESEETVANLPPLRHSGSVAVVTVVGKVLKVPAKGHDNTSASFLLEYDLAAEWQVRKGVVCAVTRSPTLAAFVHENVAVDDIVHVLGQLVPSSESGVVATVLIPNNGGSVSTVLRSSERAK